MSLPGIEALREYVHAKYRRGCKPDTLRNTVESGKHFLLFFQRRGKESLKQLTREDLEAYVEHEQDRGLKPCTVKSYLGVVYAFLGHLNDHGVVDSTVLVRKIRVKLPESLPRAMDPQDVRLLLSVVDDTRNRALILVLLRTGMRIGELLNTKVRDVNLEERKIHIPQAQKTGVGRVVYLSDDAREALRVWLTTREGDKEFLFYAHGSTTLGYAAARVVFVKALAKAGLSDRGYTVHCLRHTFASEMLNAGMRLECLQQLLGHTSVNVTRRYARLTDTTREEEYFRAMEIIEKGGIHGHYQLDPELQTVLEEKKLLRTHAHALPQRP
jgi:site-specific recombinase XerD